MFLIQPMVQNIIETLKKGYKKLCCVNFYWEMMKEGGISYTRVEFKITVVLSEAWENVKRVMLQTPWEKLYTSEIMSYAQPEKEYESILPLAQKKDGNDFMTELVLKKHLKILDGKN